MSMKTALLVALSTIYLTTVASRDCYGELIKCKANARNGCFLNPLSCPLLSNCVNSFSRCAAAEIHTENVRSKAKSGSSASQAAGETRATESVRSEVKSNSIASEVERNSLDCYGELTKCQAIARNGCLLNPLSCTFLSNCVILFSKCAAAEIDTESVRSEAESGSSASQTEGKTRGCFHEYQRCHTDERTRCGNTVQSCPRSTGCIISYRQCRISEINAKRAQFEAESILRASEIERNTRDCDLELKQCDTRAWLSCKIPAGGCLSHPHLCVDSYNLCKAAEIEAVRLEAESNSSASEVELSFISSETLAECDSQLLQCFETARMICHIVLVPCVSVPDRCRHFHDLCKAGGIESAWSDAESSSGASEVELSSISSETLAGTQSNQSDTESSSSAPEIELSSISSEILADSGSEISRCVLNALRACVSMPNDCPTSINKCLHDTRNDTDVGIESTQSEAESNSTMSEVDRNAINSENSTDCDLEFWSCIVAVWDQCGNIPLFCPPLTNCLNSNVQCNAAEIDTTSVRSETESSSSASEEERYASSKENRADV